MEHSIQRRVKWSHSKKPYSKPAVIATVQAKPKHQETLPVYPEIVYPLTLRIVQLNVEYNAVDDHFTEETPDSEMTNVDSITDLITYTSESFYKPANQSVDLFHEGMKKLEYFFYMLDRSHKVYMNREKIQDSFIQSMIAAALPQIVGKAAYNIYAMEYKKRVGIMEHFKLNGFETARRTGKTESAIQFFACCLCCIENVSIGVFGISVNNTRDLLKKIKICIEAIAPPNLGILANNVDNLKLKNQLTGDVRLCQCHSGNAEVSLFCLCIFSCSIPFHSIPSFFLKKKVRIMSPTSIISKDFNPQLQLTNLITYGIATLLFHTSGMNRRLLVQLSSILILLEIIIYKSAIQPLTFKYSIMLKSRKHKKQWSIWYMQWYRIIKTIAEMGLTFIAGALTSYYVDIYVTSKYYKWIYIPSTCLMFVLAIVFTQFGENHKKNKYLDKNNPEEQRAIFETSVTEL
jgi:hypothetical protein